jgi:hypothetical protein
MLPGETTFTRMLYGANSDASPRAYRERDESPKAAVCVSRRSAGRQLPGPLRLTPEQYAEAKARDEQYRREWAEINQALTDNSMTVTRAMSRWYPRPGERELRAAPSQAVERSRPVRISVVFEPRASS